ncbi:hypothetical protein BJ322DRAFT_1095129 [Thelephora terrestris]|uniref:Uncharacterized protein n=1 Tax=Thelephora terrestris TaxID=56493 RepID=A0A9P6L0X6_9AGAM|nr:hypothetical protein BJ322DRAFT_1095129 [Thelephora terrestris]
MRRCLDPLTPSSITLPFLIVILNFAGVSLITCMDSTRMAPSTKTSIMGTPQCPGLPEALLQLAIYSCTMHAQGVPGDPCVWLSTGDLAHPKGCDLHPIGIRDVSFGAPVAPSLFLRGLVSAFGRSRVLH